MTATQQKPIKLNKTLNAAVSAFLAGSGAMDGAPSPALRDAAWVVMAADDNDEFLTINQYAALNSLSLGSLLGGRQARAARNAFNVALYGEILR